MGILPGYFYLLRGPRGQNFLLFGGESLPGLNKNITELLKEEYIRDPKVTIGDFVKQTVAKVGENIAVAKFSRIALGLDK